MQTGVFQTSFSLFQTFENLKFVEEHKNLTDAIHQGMTKIHKTKTPTSKKQRFVTYLLLMIIIFILYKFIFFSPIPNHAQRTNNKFRVTTGVTQGGNHASYISYYHCGPKYSYEAINNNDIEILLLHGAIYNKEHWRKSGILQKLCINEKVSVTAADLSVSSDGNGLYDLFNSLVEDSVISGRPLNVVTPSASGKSVVSLAEYVGSSVEEEERYHYLERMVKSWTPIASGSVLLASEESLAVFHTKDIPVLAMHGKEDIMGLKVTDRLVKFANAEKAVTDGGHAGYFDVPDAFADILLTFLEKDN